MLPRPKQQEEAFPHSIEAWRATRVLCLIRRDRHLKHASGLRFKSYLTGFSLKYLAFWKESKGRSERLSHNMWVRFFTEEIAQQHSLSLWIFCGHKNDSEQNYTHLNSLYRSSLSTDGSLCFLTFNISVPNSAQQRPRYPLFFFKSCLHPSQFMHWKSSHSEGSRPSIVVEVEARLFACDSRNILPWGGPASSRSHCSFQLLQIEAWFSAKDATPRKRPFEIAQLNITKKNLIAWRLDLAQRFHIFITKMSGDIKSFKFSLIRGRGRHKA